MNCSSIAQSYSKYKGPCRPKSAFSKTRPLPIITGPGSAADNKSAALPGRMLHFCFLFRHGRFIHQAHLPQHGAGEILVTNVPRPDERIVRILRRNAQISGHHRHLQRGHQRRNILRGRQLLINDLQNLIPMRLNPRKVLPLPLGDRSCGADCAPRQSPPAPPCRRCGGSAPATPRR